MATSGAVIDKETPAHASGADPARTLFVSSEDSWRSYPAQSMPVAPAGSHVILSRFAIQINGKPHDLSNDEPDPNYILTMNLRSSDFAMEWGAHSLRAGNLTPHDMWITGPREKPIRAVIRRSAEVFRVIIPPLLMQECSQFDSDSGLSDGSLLVQPRFLKDRLVKYLTISLYEVAALPAPHAGPYIDAAGLVLASRLVALNAPRPLTPSRHVRALSRVHLERITNYIDANLESQIYLADLGRVVGLSRTHFAAQFKMATQHSPYWYVLHRRIARAKELMLLAKHTLVDVALLSGFCSQAHFNHVFRRFTGETPSQWRARQGLQRYPRVDPAPDMA